MESTFTITEMARRSGFPAATLRYYDEIGLVRPVSRTAAGYRLYDTPAQERLAFVRRARELGCSLTEIRELVGLWNVKPCGDVRARLRELVGNRVAASQRQVAESIAFTATLQRAIADLQQPDDDDGCSCGEGCACVQPAGRTHELAPGVPLASSAADICCTLVPDQMEGRIEDWQTLIAQVASREAVAGGIHLQFRPGVSASSVADLAAAEQDCCKFFSFAVTIDDRGVGLTVLARAEAMPIVESMFGAPS